MWYMRSLHISKTVSYELISYNIKLALMGLRGSLNGGIVFETSFKIVWLL